MLYLRALCCFGPELITLFLQLGLGASQILASRPFAITQLCAVALLAKERSTEDLPEFESSEQPAVLYAFLFADGDSRGPSQVSKELAFGARRNRISELFRLAVAREPSHGVQEFEKVLAFM